MRAKARLSLRSRGEEESAMLTSHASSAKYYVNMTDLSSLGSIRVERTARPTELPPPDRLSFGTCFSDHMFRAHHDERGWHAGAIVPRAPLQLDPAATVLQYSQCVFEGL